MASLFRFVLFVAALLAVLVFVIVPVFVAPMIASMLRDAGLSNQDMNVSLNLFGPAILSGRAQSVRVQAQDVNVPRGVVGQMDLTLQDVSMSDHSFTSVSGSLHNVRLNGPNGVPVVINSIQVDGPAGDAHAQGSMSAANAQSLVTAVASSAGVSVDSVKLGNGELTITSGSKTTHAKLRVAGRALILDQAGGDSTVLLAPPPSEDWQLDGVTVTPDGIEVDVSVDAAALANSLSGVLATAPLPSASPAI